MPRSAGKPKSEGLRCRIALIAVGGLGLAGAALVRTNNMYGLTLAGAALAILALLVLCRVLSVRAAPPSALTVPLEENTGTCDLIARVQIKKKRRRTYALGK